MIRMRSHSTPPWCWTLACVALSAISSDARAQPARFEKDVTEFLSKHCVDCHSGKKPKGDVSLDAARSEADLIKNRKLWLNVVRQIAAATPLPDARLNSRLERLLGCLANKPLDSFPQGSVDWHQAKAIYRFLANDRVTSTSLLAGWRATTTPVLCSQPLVYVAHDSTTVLYNTLKQTTKQGAKSFLTERP